MKGIAPIWAEALAARFPRFAGGTLRADVAVIGAGLTGLSAAWHLAGRGARVLVLEADRVGAGASGRSTGLLGPGVGQSLEALVRRLGKERARGLYRATLDAVAEVERLVREERIDCELEMSGQLVVARSAGARCRLSRFAELLGELGLPFEPLDAAALERRIRLSGRPEAIRLPVAGTLHPGRLVSRLAERAVKRGATILEGAQVIGIEPGRLVLQGGEVRADQVVVATAGYTAGVGLLAGRVLPVHLQALVTEPLDAAAWSAIGWAGREGLLDARRIFNYFRRTADGRIVFGGGAPRYRWGGDTSGGGSAAALDRLGRELEATFLAKLSIAGGWTGVIGYVADALPAIQRWRENQAVVHAVGWCGHGVALSVASGAWVSALLAGEALPDLPWFRNDPPLVPLEPLRWASFKTAVTVMSLMDRLA